MSACVLGCMHRTLMYAACVCLHTYVCMYAGKCTSASPSVVRGRLLAICDCTGMQRNTYVQMSPVMLRALVHEREYVPPSSICTLVGVSTGQFPTHPFFCGPSPLRMPCFSDQGIRVVLRRPAASFSWPTAAKKNDGQQVLERSHKSRDRYKASLRAALRAPNTASANETVRKREGLWEGDSVIVLIGVRSAQL